MSLLTIAELAETFVPSKKQKHGGIRGKPTSTGGKFCTPHWGGGQDELSSYIFVNYFFGEKVREYFIHFFANKMN